jgi:hypothetical protein
MNYKRLDKMNSDELSEMVMSNFDHEVNRDVEFTLRTNESTYAGYPAWNFYGSVWYEDSMFHCEIMVYGSYRETISAETLEEIMEIASNKYGWE